MQEPPDRDDTSFGDTLAVPGPTRDPAGAELRGLQTAPGRRTPVRPPQLRPGSSRAHVSQLMEQLGVTPPPTLPPRFTSRADPDHPRGHMGRYALGEALGEGGMGVVTEALDTELRRPVALKTLADPDGAGRAQLARFVAEARITSQLDHPNIVPVHDLGVAEDGQLYFVMKRVNGRSLKEILADLRAGDPEALAAWPPRRLLNAFLKVCEAVAYAHGRGVIHRDLKPANIMLGEYGEVVVMDWGIARVLDGSEEQVVRDGGLDELAVSRTMDGAIIGTPGWMAPEQARGALDELDSRSDVWSLGAILYAVLTFRPPYEEKNPMRLLYESAKGPPEDPRERAPEFAIDPDVARLCLAALAIDKEDRPRNAGALASELEEVLAGSHRAAEVSRRWRRRAIVAAVLATVGMVLVGLWAGASREGNEASRLAEEAGRQAELQQLLAEGRAAELGKRKAEAAALYRAASTLRGGALDAGDLARVFGVDALRRNLRSGSSPAAHLLWTGNKRIVAAYQDGRVVTWNIETGGPEVLTQSVGSVQRLVPVPGEDAFAACLAQGETRIWHSEMGVTLARRPVAGCASPATGSWIGSPLAAMQTLNTSPDGRHVAVARADGGIDLWTQGPAGQLEAEARTEGLDAYVGRRNNHRVCRGSHRVVPVVPYPPVAEVWARDEACLPG